MSLPIYLIGARGCGKTTIGKILSKTLNYEFKDTDHYIQIITHCNIAEIIKNEGWHAFRLREMHALRAVTALSTVVATGGGIVLSEKNCDFMRQNGKVIWLNASSVILGERLKNEPNLAQRPTLTGRTITEEIDDVLHQRMELYYQTSHYQVDATQSPTYIIKQILDLLDLNNNTI
ncbi:shikimate kinase AroL [Candidatus Pantoea carbekii]|uniref:Shikimate kinase 1 n=1 Tax=Candidatus Pantoea carbekii TaxID=1235990 RepID=U3U8G1_9GAMM|nr:shikimate kinase AroL [Candidatus Pantoea carbekii]BAO00782.1 hypothetical protein HHS_08120 [Candidatus Pantoea carbekii]